jgi:hypothetical protein
LLTILLTLIVQLTHFSSKTDPVKKFASKQKKGIFKNSGTVLTETEVEDELGLLNPYMISKQKMVGNSKAPPKKGYLRTIVSVDSKENSDDESVDEGNDTMKYPNSTGTFVPPYWLFGFKDNSLRSYLCCTVNIPSGVMHRKYGLEGKVEAKVSTCCTKLTIACEWPESMVVASCLQECLSTEWDTAGTSTNIATKFGTSSTVSNILLAFESELHKLRTKNKVSNSTMLGSTCTIILPYMVEREMVLCSPNLDPDVGSVNLYIVLKKQSTSRDEFGTSSMAVRISNGYSKNASLGRNNRNMCIGSTGYGYDSDQTLDEYEASKLLKRQRMLKSKND